jgi:putative two-component system response regulator
MQKISLTYKFLSVATTEWFASLLADKELIPYLRFLAEHHLETYEHSLRVCQLCLDLSIELGFSEEMSRQLGKAALLHDVGKTKIPLSILNKNGKLAENERQVVKQHTRFSIIRITGLNNSVISAIIAAHHEFCAAPYPRNGIDRRTSSRPAFERRRRNPEIDLASQVLAAADIMDSLAQPRVYKPAFPISKITAVLTQDFKGDPLLIDRLMKRIP